MELASVENDSSAGGFIDEHDESVKKNDRGDRIASFLGSKRVCVSIKKWLVEIVITIQSNFSLLLFGLKNYEKSLESLKVLFLDYPESEMTLDGKFLEAKTLENTHSISKAIDIYKYIIQNTQNKHAVQNARLSIKRLQASQK